MEPFDTFILKRMLVQVGGVIAIAAILGGFVLAYNATYNNVVYLDQIADGRWRAVMGDLAERYRGIPELARDIRPSLGSDAPSLDEVTGNLGLWTSAVGGGNIGKISSATTDLEASLSSFTRVLERHPDLEASGEVMDFAGALGTTEARASADQERYNEAVREYNLAISTFPASLWAENWRFTRRDYFTARIGGREPPAVPME
jgi:LemA protein